MKSTTEKSSSTTSVARKGAKRPFFSKNGGDSFFQRKESNKNNSFFGTKNNPHKADVPFFNENNIQAKLKIGKPGDKYEIEADEMADKVVRKIDQPTKAANNLGSVSGSNSLENIQSQSLEKGEDQEKDTEEGEIQPVLLKAIEEKPDKEPDLQQKCKDCDKELQKQEEEEAQPKLQMAEEKSSEEEPVQLKEADEELQKQEEEEEAQPKLQKTEEKSPEEEEPVQLKEADEELQKQEKEEEAQPKLQMAEEESPEEEEPVQLKETDEELQKQEEEEEAQPKLQKVEKKSPEEEESVQLRSSETENTASPDLQSRLNSTKGSGSSLPDSTRSSMESGFGADFSNVKIHTGSEASSMSKDLGAKAFTHGSDIYFNEGQYSPGTKSGQHLLAHELTHTVQQGAVVRQKPKESYHKTQPKVQGFFGRMWKAAKSVGRAAWNGVKKVGSAVVKAVSKGVDWILGKISPILKRIPGYTLLTVILGKDIISGNPVERNGPNLIKGFIGLIPGGHDLWQKLEESQMITDAFNWLNGEITKLGLSWAAIKTAFKTAVSSLSVTDVFSPIDAFNTKIKPIFAPILSKILTLAKKVVKKVAEFVLEGFLRLAGPFGKKVMDLLRKAGSTFWTIVGDPIGFLNNLIKAVKGGVNNFKVNIKKHLIGGLISWLTGAMGDLPIQLPQSFDVKGVLHLGLQIMGLTWANIRQKLVKRLGEPLVKAAETGVELVKTLITKGPMGLWEMLKEKAGEIKQTIMEGIRNWVITQLVKQGIIKILSFLNPAGALLQAALAIYNAIMFFVNNWQRISDFVSSVFSSIGKIAAGDTKGASSFIEKAMVQSIPIILNFIARLLNIGAIGKAITKIIQKIRKPIDKVVNKAIGFIGKQVRKLFKAGKKGLGKVKGKVKGLFQWWKKKKKFKAKDGKEHSISLKKKGRGTQLIVASDPKGIEDLVAERKSKKPKLTTPQTNALKDALVEKKALDDFIRDNMINKGAKNEKTVRLEKQIDNYLTKIKGHLINGDVFSIDDELPLTNVTYQRQGGKAFIVVASPLTKHPGNTKGENLMGGSDGPTDLAGTSVAGRANVIFDQWRRVHMLSHLLHGPKAKWNLVYATAAVNKELEKEYEHAVAGKNLKYKGEDYNSHEFYYKVEAVYGHPDEDYLDSTGGVIGNKKDFPSEMKVTVKRRDPKTKALTPIVENKPVDGGDAPDYDPANVISILKSNRQRLVKSRIDDSEKGVVVGWKIMNDDLNLRRDKSKYKLSKSQYNAYFGEVKQYYVDYYIEVLKNRTAELAIGGKLFEEIKNKLAIDQILSDRAFKTKKLSALTELEKVYNANKP